MMMIRSESLKYCLSPLGPKHTALLQLYKCIMYYICFKMTVLCFVVYEWRKLGPLHCRRNRGDALDSEAESVI